MGMMVCRHARDEKPHARADNRHGREGFPHGHDKIVTGVTGLVTGMTHTQGSKLLRDELHELVRVSSSGASSSG